MLISLAMTFFMQFTAGAVCKQENILSALLCFAAVFLKKNIFSMAMRKRKSCDKKKVDEKQHAVFQMAVFYLPEAHAL